MMAPSPAGQATALPPKDGCSTRKAPSQPFPGATLAPRSPCVYPTLPAGLGSCKLCSVKGRGGKTVFAWGSACSGGARCCSDGSVDKLSGAPGPPDPPNSSHHSPKAARCCVGAGTSSTPPLLPSLGTPKVAGGVWGLRGSRGRSEPSHSRDSPSSFLFPPS